jgi:hypothetical protein
MCEGLGTYWSRFNTSWSFNCSSWDWPSPWFCFTEEGQFYKYSFSPWLLKLVSILFLETYIEQMWRLWRLGWGWVSRWWMHAQLVFSSELCSHSRFWQRFWINWYGHAHVSDVWVVKRVSMELWSASSFVLMGILTFCTLLFLCYMETLTHSDSLCACLGQCLNCLDWSSIWLLVC